jgi:hypothetical protein
MRHFTFTITPEKGAIHPVDRAIAETPGITREALVHVNAHSNGTGVMLYRLRGDADDLAARLEGELPLITSATVAVHDDTFHFYVHVGPGQPAGKLMAVAQKYALMLIPPFEFTTAGTGLRVTAVGTHELLQQAIEECSEEVRVSIEKVGEYAPDNQNVLSVLTDRQRKTLETAVAEGYYDIPRQSTHEDIAETLGCGASTVDEHIRKVESRVFTSLIQ